MCSTSICTVFEEGRLIDQDFRRYSKKMIGVPRKCRKSRSWWLQTFRLSKENGACVCFGLVGVFLVCGVFLFCCFRLGWGFFCIWGVCFFAVWVFCLFLKAHLGLQKFILLKTSNSRYFCCMDYTTLISNLEIVSLYQVFKLQQNNIRNLHDSCLFQTSRLWPHMKRGHLF